jgi:subtilase family serine protease
LVSGLATGALAISGLAAGLPGASAMPARSAGHHDSVLRYETQVCGNAKVGVPTCQAIAMTATPGRITSRAKPLASAFTPDDIQKAYKLGGLSGKGRTVAIVDAYGYSHLESDLATFRSQYGLPACTTANGCLKIEDANGGSNYPPDNSGWDLEQALDVDAVSSACPDCNILVLQADGSVGSMETANNTAAGTKGVIAISNSWVAGNAGNSSAFDHPGIAIVAATGDYGYDGGEFPANNTWVVAAGGTSGFRDGSQRGYSESVWNGAGSGCGVNPQPKWQKRAKTTCNTKASADVSAFADPNNGGLSVYCGSFCGGWTQVGGTSEASPLLASVFALSGKVNGYAAKSLYSKKHRKHLYDITSGSNGSCGVPVCTARKGWDGPTGLGSPKGAKAF